MRISDWSSDVCSSDLAPDEAKVTLRLPLHENLKITAGQFINLTLANGVRRSYSIANPPKLSNMVDVEFHIRQMPGGAFTDHVFGKMKVRERIECREIGRAHV